MHSCMHVRREEYRVGPPRLFSPAGARDGTADDGTSRKHDDGGQARDSCPSCAKQAVQKGARRHALENWASALADPRLERGDLATRIFRWSRSHETDRGLGNSIGIQPHSRVAAYCRISVSFIKLFLSYEIATR